MHLHASSSKSSTARQQQVIYVRSADAQAAGGGHATLVTVHKSSIRFLEWAPASCGPLLLSADSEKICMWEMKVLSSSPSALDGEYAFPFFHSAFYHTRHTLAHSIYKACLNNSQETINDWECVKTFDLDNTVAVRWLNSDPKVIAELSFRYYPAFIL